MAVSTTIVDGARATEVTASVHGSSLLVSSRDVARATGWELEPEGLCRDDVCIPVRNREQLVVDGAIDLAALAATLHRPLAMEAAAGVVVLGDPAEELAESLASLDAPPFTLPDLDGNPVSLAHFAGRRKLLLAWSSW